MKLSSQYPKLFNRLRTEYGMAPAEDALSNRVQARIKELADSAGITLANNHHQNLKALEDYLTVEEEREAQKA